MASHPAIPKSLQKRLLKEGSNARIEERYAGVRGQSSLLQSHQADMRDAKANVRLESEADIIVKGYGQRGAGKRLGPFVRLASTYFKQSAYC
jgi:hypothetical protein